MTLTTLLPSLRRSIPDPINIDLWPELTSVTTSDVIVSGVSMLRLVELCDTPCIHTAAAVIPGSGGRPSSYKQAAVIVVTVASVHREGAARIVVLDACLGRVPVVWEQLRLIGRASTAYSSAVTLEADAVTTKDAAVLVGSATPAGEMVLVWLPDDLEAGDLLAVPCAAMTVLRQLRPLGAALD